MKTLFTFLFFWMCTFTFAQKSYQANAVAQFQKKMNTEFAEAATSPLTTEDRAKFKSLDFFPANASFFVIATLVKTENAVPFAMKTTTSRQPLYVKYGELHFELEGKKLKLNVYRNLELAKQAKYKDYLFLPFSDRTSGRETYIGGRYVDLKIPKGKKIAIDFNTAYNPYCAYNSKYSCPIVPLENDLDVAIMAGVKKFHD